MSRRIERRGISVADRLPREIPAVLRRVLLARGIADADQLEHRLGSLIGVGRLASLPPAVDVLLRHLDNGNRITVVGDFDADGATSTALVLRVLRLLGADAGYLVPNRFEFGYGLTPAIVDLAANDCPRLLVTVDNGISSIEGVERANALGIEVLITDHHLPGEVLPAAEAIVNPNLAEDDFPSKSLAGVGVAFYLVAALARRVGLDSATITGLLDLVALGTVADVVPLDRNNRILVSEGLRRIRAGRCVPGIPALMNEAERDWRSIVATDLGFAVAPRLNAAGRLEDMSLGIECLLTDEPAAAAEMAAHLSALNAQRREIEGEMQKEAMRIVENLRLDAQLPSCLCLYDESWHQGVVGLVAARIKEQTHRPVFAFARGDADMLKGSARSVTGLHIRDALDNVAVRHRGLVEKFGGHAMAAGLSLKASKLGEFSTAIDAEVSQWTPHMDLHGTLLTDGELSGSEHSLETAQLLRDCLPWGQQFPAPSFDGEFVVEDARIVGARHLKLKVRRDGATEPLLDAIAFNQADLIAKVGAAPVHLVYRLEVNEFRGRRSPQLVVEYIGTN
ncbi:MAG: single-stranded-DNA-specific exonuclease RecJ [Chromatiales bacterium]|jgi:single-stranded-DNA-specific exonuclease